MRVRLVCIVCHLPTDPISKNKIKPLWVFCDSFLGEQRLVIGADTRLGESWASFQAPPQVRGVFFSFFSSFCGDHVWTRPASPPPIKHSKSRRSFSFIAS